MAEHLILGQIGDPTAALPGGAGSELWYLSTDSYGQQTTSISGAVESLLLAETDDFPLAGPNATVRLRRLYVPVAWEFGSAVVQVTPIIDFQTELTPQSFVLDAGLRRQKTTLEIAVARVASWVSVRVEVLGLSGYVEVLSPLGAAIVPLAVPAAIVAGSNT